VEVMEEAMKVIDEMVEGSKRRVMKEEAMEVMEVMDVVTEVEVVWGVME